MNDLLEKLYPYQDTYSDLLYEHGMYMTITLISLFVSLALVGIFYYAINSSRFNKWYHWLLFLLISFFLVFLIATFYPRSYFAELDQYFDVSVAFLFGFLTAAYSIVLYLIFTFTLKWWSTNCSTTPF